MSRLLGVILILLASVFIAVIKPVNAASDQSYQDYIYQFDQYRKAYNDFKVAKNEYDKFNTLNSQTTVLDKTKVMLTWRDTLLRSYLIFLTDKINENQGLSDSDKDLYRQLLGNEITFLENHSNLIPSIGSINDIKTVSSQLSSHYVILQTSIRQTILELSYGDLMNLYNDFNDKLSQTTDILNQSRSLMPLAKQSTADRWMVSINNTKSLFDQKMIKIQTLISGLKGNQVDDLDRKMVDDQKELSEAKSYLQDGTSYIKELMNILRYQD